MANGASRLPASDESLQLQAVGLADAQHLGHRQAARLKRPVWVPAWLVVLLYPGLIFSFAWAVRSAHQGYALATMLVAASVPFLAARALFLVRDDAGAYPARIMLYVMFTTSSLFSLTYTLSRFAGLGYGALSSIWVSVWLGAGAWLYFRKEAPVRAMPGTGTYLKGLRVTHGITALCLLCGFVIAHLINHDLAAWSVELHATVLKSLRVWYRSAWVEPVLLGLFFIMICTGVPMVAQYSRRAMDFFRVVQIATGVYVGVFLCSHVLATLAARSKGVETDWSFAAGPVSLLDGSLLGRLIPHYFFAAFFFCVHVACGLRIVLLHHGASKIVGNRVAYGVAAAGLLVTLVLFSALLGFHVTG